MSKTLQIECTSYSIAADWYDGISADNVLLILPGFTSSKARQQDLTQYIVDATGASALVIDYSGHGESPFDVKDTRPAQHVLEVVTTYDWIKSHYPNSRIKVIGNSYGSFLAAHLAMYRYIEVLVLRAPAIYKPAALYDEWSVRFEQADDYRREITDYRNDSDALSQHPILAKRTMPMPKHVLVVAHELDETIPATTSSSFVDAFGADSIVAPGFSHAVRLSNVSEAQVIAYQKHIADWLIGTQAAYYD